MSALLPLESPLWSELQQAYGSAETIPDLLRELEEAAELSDVYDAEPMFTLWSSLCHQDEVYSASYAAFPHLVRIAEAKDAGQQSQILALAAAIAAAEDDPAHYLTPATADAYFEAIPAALALYADAFVKQQNTTGSQLIFWLSGMAAFKGKTATARLLLSFDGFIDSYNSRSFDFPLEERLLQEVLHDG